MYKRTEYSSSPITVSDLEWSGPPSNDSDSDSSVPEWDSMVRDDSELYFIKLKVHNTISTESQFIPNEGGFEFQSRGNFRRLSTRRQTKGKLYKLINRRKTNNDGNSSFITNVAHGSNNKNNNRDTNEVLKEIDPQNFFIKEGSCSLERNLGIHFDSDNNQHLVVSKILVEAQQFYNNKIKPGTKLISINDHLVNSFNINSIMEEIKANKNKYLLKFYIDKQNDSVSLADDLLFYNKEHFADLSMKFSLIVMNNDCLSVKIYEDDILYAYPSDKMTGLHKLKGAVLTLNDLIRQNLNSKPFISKVKVNDQITSIMYYENEKYLLIWSAKNDLNSAEAKLLTESIVRLLELQQLNLQGFTDRTINNLDDLFFKFFTVLNFKYNLIQPYDSKIKINDIFFPLAHEIILPVDIKLQIEDVLYELEAADYREWTDDPLKNQRLYTITGCCLYYAGHLICNHLTDNQLRNIFTYMEMTGLLILSRDPGFNKLVIWKEIYNNQETRCKLDSRSFILIVGFGNFLLTTIMETGGCTVEADTECPPSPFYVEECEQSLIILEEMHMDKYLNLFFTSHSHIQTDMIQLESKKIHSYDSNEGRHRLRSINKSSLIGKHHYSSEHINLKPALIRSNKQWFNKDRRSYSVGNNLDHSFSEDSSQQSYSEQYEGSLKNTKQHGSDWESSGSDWESLDDYQQFNSNNKTESTIKESFNKVADYRFTAGAENVLFNYVKVDSLRGIMIAPVKDLEMFANSDLYSYILKHFKKACYDIREVLLKKSRCSESEGWSNKKSLTVIKEHGILFEIPSHVVTTYCHNHVGDGLSFWVVGYVTNESPGPNELYICYHESVPQDIVEVNFRMSNVI